MIKFFNSSSKVIKGKEKNKYLCCILDQCLSHLNHFQSLSINVCTSLEQQHNNLCILCPKNSLLSWFTYFLPKRRWAWMLASSQKFFVNLSKLKPVEQQLNFKDHAIKPIIQLMKLFTHLPLSFSFFILKHNSKHWKKKHSI